MSSSNYPFIVPSDSDIKDTFSSTNTTDYTPASPDYFPASLVNTSPDSLNDLTKDLLASLAFLPFHDDPYMKIEGLGNGRMIIQKDFDKLETELQEARAQIFGFHIKQIGHGDEIVLSRVRTSTLEMIIENIQVRHRSDKKNLLDAIYELKNRKEGPPNY
nr:hypothetical protein [Tanacetum cinerariifolium]